MRHSIFAAFGLLASTIAQNDVVSYFEDHQHYFSTLSSVLKLVPDLADALGSASNVTILAPTNSAFKAVDPDTIEGQAIANEDVDAISALLAYHVVQGTYGAYQANDIKEIPTWVPTLLDPSYEVDGTPVADVTGGQNVGLIANYTAKNTGILQVLSGNSAYSTIINGVRSIWRGPIELHMLTTRKGQESRRRYHSLD